jgi:glycosyltransferase involved in cell wall biosynthesis
MKVALLASGEAIHSRRWAQGLSQRDLEVRLFTLEAPAAEFADESGIPVVSLPNRRLPDLLRYPLASPALNRELRRFGPDLLDAHFVPNYGLLGAMSRRRPLVVNCWGSDLLIGRDAFRRTRARWVLHRADLVFVDAENLGDAARGLGVGEDRLRVVPWGVDSRRFAFTAAPDARRQRRQSWPEAWRDATVSGGAVVVSTRVLHPIYDVATLVRAWPAVVRQHPDARLLIAGDGPDRSSLQSLAEANGAAATTSFLGRLPHESLPDLLAGADLYVSTSLSDSTSLSLLEAMSAGLYPIVSDISGNREWVSPESAALFPVGESEELAGRIIRSLDAADLSDARRRNRRLVESRADWQRTLDLVVEEYRSLVPRNPSQNR